LQEIRPQLNRQRLKLFTQQALKTTAPPSLQGWIEIREAGWPQVARRTSLVSSNIRSAQRIGQTGGQVKAGDRSNRTTAPQVVHPHQLAMNHLAMNQQATPQRSPRHQTKKGPPKPNGEPGTFSV